MGWLLLLAVLAVTLRPLSTGDDARDQRTALVLSSLVPRAREIATRWLAAARSLVPIGYSVHLTAGRRTEAEQAALYAQGRTAPGSIVTYADGRKSRSSHQDGTAWDFVVITSDGSATWEAEAYRPLGELGERMGCLWGGRFPALKDYPHLEVSA